MPRFYRATLEPGFEELLAVVLSPRELDLYSKLKGERRRRSWLVGRLAAKALLLGAGTALDPRDVEVLPDGRGVPRALLRGEPLQLSLSIAHSRREPEGGRLSVEGFAGLADPEGEGHIGVDLERVRPLHPRLVERAFHPEEREALCALKEQAQAEGLVARWALKEAAYKALGAAGLLPSPRGPGLGLSLSWRDFLTELSTSPRPHRDQPARVRVPPLRVELVAGVHFEGAFCRAWALLKR